MLTTHLNGSKATSDEQLVKTNLSSNQSPFKLLDSSSGVSSLLGVRLTLDYDSVEKGKRYVGHGAQRTIALLSPPPQPLELVHRRGIAPHVGNR